MNVLHLFAYLLDPSFQDKFATGKFYFDRKDMRSGNKSPSLHTVTALKWNYKSISKLKV